VFKEIICILYTGQIDLRRWDREKAECLTIREKNVGDK
jgi:hypothetical protein